MNRSRDNVMEMGGQNLFIHDPFLSLDHDLDDVSEVIRNNLFGEQPNLFDSSRTPSPQYQRDTNIFILSNNLDGNLVFGKNQPNYPMVSSAHDTSNLYDKEIGEIVSLLQDDNPLLSSPGPSSNTQQQYKRNFDNLQIKQDFSMMDTTSNEVCDSPPQQQQLNSAPIQYASTPGYQQSLDYNQIRPQDHAQFSYYNHPTQQYLSSQFVYEMPRASSSSAIHTISSNELQQVVVDETQHLVRPLSDQNLSMYSSYPSHQQMPQQNDNRFAPESSSSNNGDTKQELIKMLLEMSPGDFERLRTQKTHHKYRKTNLTSPTPLDPSRKRLSIQLAASPQQPLLLSVGSDLSSEMSTKQSCFSPDLVSPQSSSTGPISEWREESDNESAETLQPLTRRGPKTERRTAHNLIEKKYRCSINDRINHLKEMLAPEETKLSKSATLRKAIDHIHLLRQQNIDLMKENELLKKSIKALGAEVPPIVNNKYNRHTSASTSLSIPDDSSESTGSAQTSNSTSPKGLSKKSGQMPNQLRISLCIFMFTVLIMNPFAMLFETIVNGDDQVKYTSRIVGRVPIHHRTLKAFDSPFDEEVTVQINWWHQAFTRHAIIWLVNLFIVFMILTRLLVYGEPVTDRRSPAWNTFLETKRHANDAISACNYKEAQRQLSDALFLLGRTLPRPGGIEEFMSVAWQVIRHILNGLWIGRWFSRRRRSESMSQPAVCKSHASTALVYHQLNQLHLLGIDAIENGSLTGLNLALCAVNLAESAGISREGITHWQRADIYVHAALGMKLCLPRILDQIVYAYFLQRARRHVRKSALVDGVEMRHYQWIFHPLSQNFLTDVDVIREILVNTRQMVHFPFSHSYISPKPIDRLTSAFKMHLLALMMNQLNSSVTTLQLLDFVDISQLLLYICESDSSPTTPPLKGIQKVKDETVDDWEASTKGQSDDLCTWWTHIVTCGLYWKHGDSSRESAQKHYSLIRKCSKPLLTSNLALGVGMALCTRKICMEDQSKKEFVNMVWFHVKESFLYIRKEEPLNLRKKSTMAIAMNQMIRCLTYEWLLNSMLDVWRLNLDNKIYYWEQPAPSQMRQLYKEVLTDFSHSGVQSTDRYKILVFKQISRLLDGANPLATLRLVSKQCPELINDYEPSTGVQDAQVKVIKRLKEDIRNAASAKISD